MNFDGGRESNKGEKGQLRKDSVKGSYFGGKCEGRKCTGGGEK